jgi:nitrate reductase gamma subunit
VFTAGAILFRLVVRDEATALPAFTSGGAARRGRIPLFWGLLVILAGHLLALTFPGAIRSWNGEPVRLYVLEGTGLALGLWAAAGLGVIWYRWFHAGRPIDRKTLPADVVVAIGFTVLVASGILVAIFHRFGSAWGTDLAAPWVWSLFGGNADTEIMGDLPFLAQLHALSFFAVLPALPLSRWWWLVAQPSAYLARLGKEMAVPGPVARPAGAVISWGAAYGRAALIAILVIMTTVWLPSRVLNELAGQERWVQDVVGAGVWATALGAVLVGLRRAQRAGRL